MDIARLYDIYLKNPVISTDTRKIQPGSLFFALKGQHFDGNAFAQKALEAGATFSIISDPEITGDRYIHVKDTLQTLQALALHHRKQLMIPFIAITGSNGKTTTKELIASVLKEKYRVKSTSGNLNNHIGVPLTLLAIDTTTEIAIIEMGANHPGEIDFLCNIAMPTHGIITNIGKAHLEGFGSIEGVRKAKGELFDYLNAHDGTAFINTDDPRLAGFASQQRKKVTYSILGNVADMSFQFSDDGQQQGFNLRIGNQKIESSLFGKYNAHNVAAAYVIGSFFKVPSDKINAAISSFQGGSNRSEMITIEGCIIIKDAYNANPSSMGLAIDAFAEKYPQGWVILGDMKELGKESSEAHLSILKQLQNKKFERIFVVGPEFKKASKTLPPSFSHLVAVDSIDDIKENWQWHDCYGKSLLIKGSRSMQLEKLLEH